MLISQSLRDTLESRVRDDYPLGAHSWFGCGGKAREFLLAHTEKDLAAILRALPENAPLHIIGRLSNVLIRDGGLDGLTIRLGREFARIEFDDEGVTAGGAVLDRTLALTAFEHGFGGLEFLSGIPGAVGGAIAMNAGCFGREIKDCLTYVEIMNRAGEIERLSAERLNLSYRHAEIPEDHIILRARFSLSRTPDRELLEHIKINKDLTQPTKSKTGGSTFANPPNMRAWELIDKIGFRGKKRGGAQFSEKHCNFLINTGDATAADLETLGENARQAVLREFGIELKWEIKRVGRRA